VRELAALAGAAPVALEMFPATDLANWKDEVSRFPPFLPAVPAHVLQRIPPA
jgi:SNF2 family DNA or RNA helicase